MALPVKSLPVLQNWDCHVCGNCCREYLVHVTDEEKKRIESQNWEADPAMQGKTLFQKSGRFWKRIWVLNHEKDGACVFLNEKGLCRIHAKFGSEGKPLACRVYPFVLIPTGDHWRIGLRFACPSVAKDLGRSTKEHLPDVKQYALALEEREGIARSIVPAPVLQSGQSAPWSDLLHFVKTFREILADPAHPMEWRIRQALALIQICRQAKFDVVTGAKLAEFLDLVRNGLTDEIPAHPQDVPKPSWIGRILFRQLVALCSRKDSGPLRGVSRYGRIALLWAGWKFARGSGRLPRLHAQMPYTTFEALEQPHGPLPASSEEMLTRYFQVKLESLQFCGPTNFNRAFWDGLESLFLTFPCVLWLSRVFHNVPREEAILWGLRIVDDNFGYNVMLGTQRQLIGQRILSKRGEIAKLTAWYSR